MINRRRILTNCSEEEVFMYPDHFCIKFTGTSVVTGYYFGPSCVTSLIIDDEVIPSNQYSTYVKSASSSTIQVPTSGDHTIYFKCNVPSNYRLYICGKYFRFPITATNQLGQSTPRTYITGELLDSLSETPPTLYWSDFGTQAGTAVCPNLKMIRVPIGCGAAYKDAKVWKQKKNIIVEYDFKLDPNYVQS